MQPLWGETLLKNPHCLRPKWHLPKTPQWWSKPTTSRDLKGRLGPGGWCTNGMSSDPNFLGEWHGTLSAERNSGEQPWSSPLRHSQWLRSLEALKASSVKGFLWVPTGPTGGALESKTRQWELWPKGRPKTAAVCPCTNNDHGLLKIWSQMHAASNCTGKGPWKLSWSNSHGIKQQWSSRPQSWDSMDFEEYPSTNRTTRTTSSWLPTQRWQTLQWWTFPASAMGEGCATPPRISVGNRNQVEHDWTMM